MSDLVSFFLDATGDIADLHVIEISHPDFTKVFRFVNSDEQGISVKHEDGIEYFYEYAAFRVDRSNVTADLDQAVSITFNDYDDELKNAVNQSDYMIPATFKYRIYRDDDLNYPMITLETLKITDVNSDDYGVVTFDAKAEELNTVGTGERYTRENCPCLRGV